MPTVPRRPQYLWIPDCGAAGGRSRVEAVDAHPVLELLADHRSRCCTSSAKRLHHQSHLKEVEQRYPQMSIIYDLVSAHELEDAHRIEARGKYPPPALLSGWFVNLADDVLLRLQDTQKTRPEVWRLSGILVDATPMQLMA